MNQKENIFEYYSDSHSYANSKFITTPLTLSKKILMEVNSKIRIPSSRDIIKSPITFFDIYVKDISFMWNAYLILDNFYSKIIPNNEERIQFILDNCLYGFFHKTYIVPHLSKIKKSLEVFF